MTVEAAISLCALITVLGMVLGGVAMVTDQLRCTDAARAAARLLARGEHTLAREAVRTLAPLDARMEVRHEAGGIAVTVSADAARGLLPVFEIRADAYAAIEPGAYRESTISERTRVPV